MKGNHVSKTLSNSTNPGMEDVCVISNFISKGIGIKKKIDKASKRNLISIKKKLTSIKKKFERLSLTIITNIITITSTTTITITITLTIFWPSNLFSMLI